MHTLPILAEYLMSWSCSLWRFKFTIGLLSAQWLDGLKWGNTADLATTLHSTLYFQNKVQSKVEPTVTAVTILVSGHIDNLIISQSFTTSPRAVVQSETVNFSKYILSSGLHYGWIRHHYTYDDWQVNISDTNINILSKGQSYSNHIASGQGSKNRIDKNIV